MFCKKLSLEQMDYIANQAALIAAGRISDIYNSVKDDVFKSIKVVIESEVSKVEEKIGREIEELRLRTNEKIEKLEEYIPVGIGRKVVELSIALYNLKEDFDTLKDKEDRAEYIMKILPEYEEDDKYLKLSKEKCLNNVGNGWLDWAIVDKAGTVGALFANRRLAECFLRQKNKGGEGLGFEIRRVK